MGLFLFFMTIIILGSIYAFKGAEKNKIKIESKNDIPINESIKRYDNKSQNELVDNMTTIEQIVAFETEMEKIIYNSSYSREEQKRAETALEKVREKIFFRQILPQLTLDASLNELKIGYQYFTKKEADKIIKKLPNWDYKDISGFDILQTKNIEDNLESKPTYYESLEKYVELIESNLEFKHVKSKIETLINNDKSFETEFFIDEYDDNTILLNYLLKRGIPKPYLLIENGFITVERIKKLNDTELKSIKGFGIKTIEEFKLNIHRIE